jgi:hypothetical protein
MSPNRLVFITMRLQDYGIMDYGFMRPVRPDTPGQGKDRMFALGAIRTAFAGDHEAMPLPVHLLLSETSQLRDV